MTEKVNPFLEQENYYEGYQASINKLKNNPEIVEIEKLCYLVFRTEDGKKLIDEITERYIIPGFVNPVVPHASNAALFYEGFKEAFRMIKNSIKSHEQRILAESIKDAETKQA